MLWMRIVLPAFFNPNIFQYYEMSYGLNVEMHKQVKKQNRPMGIFQRQSFKLLLRKAGRNEK